MRVIAGTYRSRRLIAPSGLVTRPTSDRLRETLFNVLSPRIAGAAFADLYAGSGAVGIEALSRGASLVYFADAAPAAVAAIRANLSALDIRSGFRIESAKVSTALRRMAEAQPPLRFQIIYLDPPYSATLDYGQTLSAIGRSTNSLLAPDGIVVAEHSRLALEHSYGPLQRYRTLDQGEASLSFYRVASDSER